MWFLIKATFWFTLVLVLLPLTNPETEARLDSQPQVRVGATVTAATSALDDFTGLCSRRPDVCKTGGETLAALGARARDGALIAYQFLDGHFGKDHGAVMTGSVPQPAVDTPSSAAAATQPAEQRVAAIPIPMPAPRRSTSPTLQDVTGSEPMILPKPYSPPRP